MHDRVKSTLTVGIDASRARSGGARVHIIRILDEFDGTKYGIEKVHLWTYSDLAESIPNFSWLEKHSPKCLSKSLIHQLWWQFWCLPKIAKRLGCDLMFNVDAGSVSNFKPNVTLSQDLLTFEPIEMRRFFPSKDWLRLFILKRIHKKSLQRSYANIFLTNYAFETIVKKIGKICRYKVINHGFDVKIDDKYSRAKKQRKNRELQLLYISNAEVYKHQWHVVRAVGELKREGFEVSLLLIGGGKGRAQKRLNKAIREVDPSGDFVMQKEFLPHSAILRHLNDADIFVFASSCESMPVTLLEAMAFGLPIASSNRGPMPEILQDAGIYFDPENEKSITAAIRYLLLNKHYREEIAQKAKSIATKYSWNKCSNETFGFLSEILQEIRVVS